MSRQRLFVEAAALDGERVLFTADQTHQLRKVLRLRSGDRVHVFDGVEPVDYVVELTAPGQGRVVDQAPQPPEPRTRLIAYPALLQRDKFEPVLQKLVEVGVCGITPVVTARSLVREAPDERRVQRWQSIMREAAEQCGRGRVPRLCPTRGFAEAVAQATAEGTAVLAYEAERQLTLRAALASAASTVSVLVGPEGGYAPDEAALAARCGVQVITLGPRTLRTETASPVLSALVLHELGDLSSW